MAGPPGEPLPLRESRSREYRDAGMAVAAGEHLSPRKAGLSRHQIGYLTMHNTDPPGGKSISISSLGR
jgi:hypothetical protein